MPRPHQRRGSAGYSRPTRGLGLGSASDGAHVHVKSSEPDDTAIDLSDPVPLENNMSVVTCGSSGYQAARDREDPGGLGCQELPPRRARPTRRRIDARSTQDLPHGGRRNCHAELRELAGDPPVSPQWIHPRQADDKAGDAPDRRRASWLAPLARAVLPRRQPAVPGQQRRWRHGEDFRPAPARYKLRQRGEPGVVSRLVPHPAGVPPQYRVLMPEHQQLSILRQVTAEH
jgi:hypothetical protein